MEFTDEQLASEEWRPVVGWERYYSVSNLGRVKRLKRDVITNYGKERTLPEKIVSTNPRRDGYVSVLLKVGDRKVVTTAHRLVAIAFVPNDNNYRFILHVNGDGSDNRVENIMWVKSSAESRCDKKSSKVVSKLALEQELAKHTLPDEEWRDIVGYENLYLVSNYGRVFSVPRPKAKAGVLNPSVRPNGYLNVTLCKDGTTKNAPIHRLVAEHFLENPDNLPVVNHKDEDRLNCFADNLEWCTHEYNVNYGTAQERRKANTDYAEIGGKVSKSLRGRTDIKRNTKKVAQYSLDGELLHQWNSITEASRCTGVSVASISGACNRGEHWMNGVSCGYRWDFEEECKCAS